MTNKHPERDLEHIRYALRCAARVAELIAIDRVRFFDSPDLIDALCWNMYQIADVTGKISDAVQACHPEVPWRAIAGLRNFYAHVYEGIDIKQMWSDLHRGDVADLATQLRAIESELESHPNIPES